MSTMNASNYNIDNKGISNISVERTVSGDTVALFATPFAFLGEGQAGGLAGDGENELSKATPIGAIQSMNISQFKQTSRFNEVGSSKSYIFDTSKVNGQLNISSVMYDGMNLLAALTSADKRLVEEDKDYSFGQDNGLEQPGYGKTVGEGDDSYYSALLMNLSSAYFRRGLGLIIVFHDTNGDPYGAYFLQEARINQHGLGVNANSPLIGENASIVFERAIPIKVNSI